MLKGKFIAASAGVWVTLALAMPLPVASAQSPDAAVVIGDARISNCGFGQREGENRQCFNDVLFHVLPGLPENEIARLTAERGWRLASPEEVNLAWEHLGLNQPSFGKMANGKYAAPVQADSGPALKRGVNLRGADVAMFANGFFYVDGRTIAPAAPEQAAPASAPAPVAAAPQARNTGCPGGQRPVERDGNLVCEGSINIAPGPSSPIYQYKEGDPRPQQYFLDQLADKCADPGNFMLDGWTAADRPVLEAAGHKLIAKKGYGYSTPDMSHVVAKLKADPKVRWEFAPFMLEAAWESLSTTNPSPAQAAFKERFESWAACDKNLVARRTLWGWNRHIGKSSGDATIDGVTIEWIDPNPQYKTADWSLAAKKGPSVYGFDVTNDGNPLFIGSKGRVALASLIGPMQARETPDFDDVSDLRYVQEDFLGVTIAATGGASLLFGGALATAVGAIPVYNQVLKQKHTFQASKAIKQTTLDEAVDRAVREGSEASIKSAKKAASKNASKTFKVTRNVLKDAFKKAFAKTSTKVGSKVGAKVAGQATGKAVGSATGKIAGSTAGFVAIVAIAAAIYGEELAEIIQTKLYDDGLNYDAKNIVPYDVDNALGPNPGVIEKSTVYSLLLKMLIAEPADRNRLTIDVPIFDCPMGLVIKNGVCTADIGFYNQDGVTLAAAKKIAAQNGWRLALPAEIELAWSNNTLHNYAFGMMADGKFAVPVQRDFPNFKKGHNIGAVGGNQGFFYVSAFVDNAEAAEGGTFIQNAKAVNVFFPGAENSGFADLDKTASTWILVDDGDYVRLQNAKSSGTFAYADKGKLAFGSIPAGDKRAQWKVVEAAGSFFRIENVALPHRYLHNENGIVELGYIEPNWKGALWHMPG